MGKQGRSKRPDNNIGKGKVTPIQVAFIVDRYLSDNNFSETRSVFRTEASSLISKSPVQEAPKSLLSLVAMLNEYICLKEQKVMLDQERARMDQEKLRVQTLLNGMQDVMNTYNASASIPVIQPPVTNPAKSTAVVPQSVPSSGSPSGYIGHNTPTVMPTSMPSNTVKEHEYFSPTVPNCPLTRKRTVSKVVPDTAPTASKKSRSKIASKNFPNKVPATQSKNTVPNQNIAQSSSVVELSPDNRASNESLVQGSSVAKSLFSQPSVPTPTNSSGPKTPPQPVSSQSEKSPLGNSFVANCSASNTPQQITPINCTVISSERVTVSPYKQMAVYTMERNHCISSSSPVKTNLKRLGKRDHVKGRLDFDGSDVAVSSDKTIINEISTSDSEKEVDIFDMDLPNLDAFGPNFSFSELLVDFDLDCEGIGYPCQPTLGASMDNISGSSQDSGEANAGADQVLSEYSSTVTEVLSGKDMNPQGPDTLTAVKSITKCIRILSPAKGCRNSLDQQNC
ncbi:DNA double-strand break repair rad50 ATPase, putative isoform 1 [Melia azedarach]|uniref:DNA double-strand break repair rad50 ATPase, putative isoform 1 n=1 Tax=Melia azedarach TaxID=155640 RepID=A0ACC1WZT3_MELAZ|nr:DNA double-strand break repair rad50 ATPase, putative isoform 1 [Melia azedarach]